MNTDPEVEADMEELKNLLVRYVLHVMGCEGAHFLYAWGDEFTEEDATTIMELLDKRAPGWRNR